MKILFCVLLLGVAVPAIAQDLTPDATTFLGRPRSEFLWWQAQSTFSSPSKVKTFGNQLFSKANDSRPISDTHRLSGVFNPMIGPPIIRLNARCRPSTVVFGIGTVVVDAIECGSDWSPPHIFEKIGETIPLNRDATTTVVRICGITFDQASSSHVCPDVQLARSIAAPRFTMRDGSMRGQFGCIATTTCGDPIQQIFNPHVFDGSTITTANKAAMFSGKPLLKEANYGPSSKSLSNTITSRYSQDTAIIQPSNVSAAAEDRLFYWTMVAAMAAHGADLASTSFCLGAGTCRELNKFLLRFDRPAAFGGAKMGIAGLQLWGVAKFHELFPKAAIAVNVLSAALFTGIAIHNGRAGQ